MVTTIDRFGRIVIPKAVRDMFGLKPGETIMVEETKDGILLKPLREGAGLAYKSGILVYTGEVEGDITNAVRKMREERIRKLMGPLPS